MILFLHHRYRATGGEERAVDDLLWLVREHLGEDAELLQRDSARIGKSQAAAGMLAGGVRPDVVARAVRQTRARVVHAHNLNPTLGWRALAAARAAGARVVMHLHQYRLVCAVGVCFTRGSECTRCHGRNALPGIALNCRGSRGEAAAYGAGQMLWQRRLASQVDEFIVPSRFAAERLHALGAPIGTPHVVAPVIRRFAEQPVSTGGGYALLASRLVPEKGVDIAVAACRIAGRPLIVAGEGPERQRFGGDPDRVRFVGRVDQAALAQLRAGAAVALAPSRSAETFGLGAAEAMAAGLPVAASRIGAMPELVPADWLVPPGDAEQLAAMIERLAGDPSAGHRAIAQARQLVAPERVAPALAAVYAHAEAGARKPGAFANPTS